MGRHRPRARRRRPKGTGGRIPTWTLNYARTLEHLEHAFYRDSLEEFSDDDLRNAERVSNFGDEIREKVPDRIATIRDHEKGRVDTITSVVEDLGGEPVQEAEYTFEYEAAGEFIGTSQVLENTGVAAYAGAGPTVSNDAFVAAASIHRVEARHAGYLNELNGESAYPNAVDEATSVEEVDEAVEPFLENGV